MFIFRTARAITRVLRVLEKRETSAAKARARCMRQSRDWVLKETNMATDIDY